MGELEDLLEPDRQVAVNMPGAAGEEPVNTVLRKLGEKGLLEDRTLIAELNLPHYRPGDLSSYTDDVIPLPTGFSGQFPEDLYVDPGDLTGRDIRIQEVLSTTLGREKEPLYLQDSVTAPRMYADEDSVKRYMDKLTTGLKENDVPGVYVTRLDEDGDMFRDCRQHFDYFLSSEEL